MPQQGDRGEPRWGWRTRTEAGGSANDSQQANQQQGAGGPCAPEDGVQPQTGDWEPVTAVPAGRQALISQQDGERQLETPGETREPSRQ